MQPWEAWKLLVQCGAAGRGRKMLGISKESSGEEIRDRRDLTQDAFKTGQARARSATREGGRQQTHQQGIITVDSVSKHRTNPQVFIAESQPQMPINNFKVRHINCRSCWALKLWQSHIMEY